MNSIRIDVRLLRYGLEIVNCFSAVLEQGISVMFEYLTIRMRMVLQMGVGRGSVMHACVEPAVARRGHLMVITCPFVQTIFDSGTMVFGSVVREWLCVCCVLFLLSRL